MSKRSDSKSLEDLISALPDKKNGKMKWTMAEDAMILKYSIPKGFRAIGEVLGKTKAAVHARYHFLKGQAK